MAKQKQKKEPKIPAEQARYQAILTKQLFGEQPSPEEQFKSFQTGYDEYVKNKEAFNTFKADYDAWVKARTPAEQPKVEQAIETTPTVQKPAKTAVKSQEKTQKTVAKTAPKEQEKSTKKYLTHADVIPSLLNKSVETTKEVTKKEKAKNINKIGGSVSQLDLSKYNLPESKENLSISKADATMDKYKKKMEIQEKEKTKKAIKQIQNNYVMSKDELKEAKATAKKELKKLDKENLTPEEQQKKEIYTDLKKKTSAFDASIKGARKIPFRVSKFIADAGSDVYQAFAEPAAYMLDQWTGDGFEHQAKVRNEVEDYNKLINENYADLRAEEKEAEAQHPAAYAAGNATTQMAMYYATNPLFDALGKGLGITSKAGQFLANQLGQGAQDAALDIYPAYQEAMEDGALTEEEKNELVKMGLTDVGMNLAIPGIQYGLGKAEQTAYESLAKSVGNDADIFKTMDSTGALKSVPDYLREMNDVRNVMEAQKIPSITDEVAGAGKYNQFAPNAPRAIYDTSNAPDAVKNYLSRNADEIPGIKNTVEATPAIPQNTFALPEDVSAKIESHLTEIADPMNAIEKSGIMNTVTDEKALSEWKKLNEAYSDYAMKSMFGENIDEIEDAKKTFDNARKNYSNAMKDIDPEVSKAFNKRAYSNKVGRPLYERNIIQASDQSQEAAEAINELENIGSADGINNIGKRPYARSQGVSPSIENEAKRLSDAMDSENVPSTPEISAEAKATIKEEAKKLKSSFAGKVNYIKDGKNEYAIAFKEALDEFADSPSTETFSKAKSALNDYIANSGSKKMKDWNGNWYDKRFDNFDPETGESQFTKAFDELGKKYGINTELNNAITETKPLIEQSAESAVKGGTPEVKPVSKGKTAQNVAGSTAPEPNEIDIPKGMDEGGQSRHIRGAGKMKMEGVSDEVVADFQDNPQLHSVLRNADTKAKAENIYNSSKNPEVEFRDMLRKHDPAALPLGHQLAKDYSAAGKHEAAAQLYREMGEQLTKAGQFSQAAVINMMKNDPLTALQYAQRQIDSLNEQGLKRFGKKWTDFKLTDEEKKLFDNIAPGDEDAIKAAYDQIGERLGKEYPTSFMDKLLEGRKIAMLFNVRTMVRNTLANPPTLGMRWASDRVEALGQNIAHLINPEFKVNQSLTGSGIQGRKLATQAFNSPRVQAYVEGTVGKYETPDLKNNIIKDKQMYKGTPVEKFIDKWVGSRVTDVARFLDKKTPLKNNVNLTGGIIPALNKKLFGKKGVQSGLETVRNATYKMLDLGDSPFVKENFIERLGSYIHAQKIKNLDDIPDEAIETAWEEAMKATYKDESWAVKMLTGFKKNGLEKVPYVGRALSQAAIPFLQAPGNIAARMVDYSPIRGSKGIVDIILGAKANDLKKVERGIEEAAKGLTGSGLVYLGMKLRESGLITGTFSKDKDQKAFQKQNGFKEFAIHIGNKYFTYDWAQPFAQELITGTLLQDAIEKSDEYNSDLLAYIDKKAGTHFNTKAASKALGVAGEATKASINSWFNATPLQGLHNLLSGNNFDKDDIAGSIKSTLVDDFAGAFIPATVNATAKSIDPVQRNTTDKSSSTATFVNQQVAKLPVLSKTLPAKYDTWGRKMKYADNKAWAAASRFVIPGEFSYDRNDPVDKEVNRLFEATGDKAVFPQVAPDKVGDKTLNNRETSRYQKEMGQRSRKLVEEFVNSKDYKKLSDEDKASIIANLYSASKGMEDTAFGKEPSSADKNIAELYKKEGAKGLVKEYITKNAFAQHDVNDSDGARAVYNDLGDRGLENFAKIKGKLNGSSSQENIKKAIDSIPSMTNTDKAKYYSYFKTDAKPGSNPYGYVPGINYSPEDDATYQTAKKQIPSLSPEDFYKRRAAIDTDGNGGIKEEEILNYINANAKSFEEAEQMYKAYYGIHTNKKNQIKHIVKGKKGYASSY